jgi:hypothetical protein
MNDAAFRDMSIHQDFCGIPNAGAANDGGKP